jgi:quercetin dioxygenase-like cupin family protein
MRNPNKRNGAAGPKLVYEDAFTVIEPHINSAGIHDHPFDPAFPADVRFCCFEKARRFRLNRHAYYELLHVQSGEITFRVQDHEVLVREGDLFVMGSTLLH